VIGTVPPIVIVLEDTPGALPASAAGAIKHASASRPSARLIR
jgi:hypothetical protein